MHQQPTDSASEVKYLQRCMNNLVSVLALPSVWSSSEPGRILEIFLGAIMEILDLDFLYVRARIDSGGTPSEVFRAASKHGLDRSEGEVRQALSPWLARDTRRWTEETPICLAEQELRAFPMQMGLEGELGLVVAVSRRDSFPEQTEKLILSVAANQTALALQQARRLSEHKRVTSDLERRVSERTAELASANEVLRKEIFEKKRAEDELRASETNLRRIVDSIPGLVCTMDTTGEIQHLNRPLLEYFGKTPEELRGWKMTDAAHPDELPDVVRAFTYSITTGTPYAIEHRCRRSDGVYRWFQVRALAVHDTDNIISGWYVLLTDIDDRKRAENALRANERNLSQIIDTMPVLAWSALPDGYVEFLNQRWLNFTGLPPEQARGWGWADLIHPDDANGLVECWQAALAFGTRIEVEARMRRFDGQYRWFLFRAEPMRDESGAITKWYGTNTDIDDRKRAEQALRVRELNLRQITETIPEMLWSASPDGTIDYCNGRFLNYTGISLDQVMRDGWMNLLHPDDVQPTVEVWKSCVNSGAPYRVEARTFHAADDMYRWCVTSALPLLDLEGRIVKWHGTVVDMHDWKQAQEELRNTQAELARVSRVMSIGQMTASIAHEVSQPLSGIITNASTCLRMLNSTPPNVDGARETTQRTIRDGNRATDVITRLRTLFSKKQINIEPVDVNEAVREVLALLSSELQKQDLLLLHQFSNNLPHVMGDRVQLQQVILNLVRNASDAMEAVIDRPRQLVIRTEIENNCVRVSVQDSGVGFDPEIRDRIFESFFTTKREGMGVGLSVSRSIVEAHNGKLWAVRNDGPGATFTFSIPCDHTLTANYST